MAGFRPIIRFSGDLDDPWARDLHAALPASGVDFCGKTLPEEWPKRSMPDVLVLHRGALTVAEADRLRRLREGGDGPKVVLVYGPHVRYHQLMAWSDLVDVVLPEATALETIGRHVVPGPVEPVERADRGDRGAVRIASGQFELARMLLDALSGAGFSARQGGDDPLGGKEPWVVWDVPVLEPDWPERLSRAAGRRRVIALMGLSDREEVSLARQCGAAACLELPGDPDDLIHVLDRLGSAGRSGSRPAGRRRRLGEHRHRPRSAWGRAPGDLKLR